MIFQNSRQILKSVFSVFRVLCPEFLTYRPEIWGKTFLKKSHIGRFFQKIQKVKFWRENFKNKFCVRFFNVLNFFFRKTKKSARWGVKNYIRMTRFQKNQSRGNLRKKRKMFITIPFVVNFMKKNHPVLFWGLFLHILRCHCQNKG